MKPDSNLINLLIRSFDEDLTAADSRLLQRALADSPALRAQRKKLQRMRRMLGELDVARKPDFADSVLSRLKRQGKNTVDVAIASIFPKAAAACLFFFFLSLLAIYFSSGNLSIDTIIGIQGLTPEDAGIYLSGR